MALLAGACGRSPIDLGGASDAGSQSDDSAVDEAVGINAVWRGAGCGMPPPAETQPTARGRSQGYTQFTVMGTGANLTSAPMPAKAGPRTFWVRLPEDYDPARPYRVVFLGQGCGLPGMANVNALALYREAAGGTEQAIYVAIDLPSNSGNMGCYDDQDGPSSEEWEAFALFMSFVDAHYCADLNKIYVVGYSTGATLANMWGCYFAGAASPPRKLAPHYHIRAQAALWGLEPPEQPPCGGPVAAFWMHGTVSVISPITEGAPSLARVALTNGCDTAYDAGAHAPWHDDLPALAKGLCRTFTGCSTDYPVVYCAPEIPVQVGPYDVFAIPALTTFFDELEAGR